jgi:hypothetical protein
MAAELITAPEAEDDIADAYAWYESRRPGLGEEFLSCVDACIEAILRTPQMRSGARELSPGVGAPLSLRGFLRVHRR